LSFIPSARHQISKKETFAKRSILFKFKEEEDFNRRYTLSMSRIKI
jgi:hypothetical protein